MEDAFIVLHGTIRKITLLPQGIQFNLETDDGLFSVQVTDIPCFGVRPQATICLLGRPRTYFHRGRRAHQVVVDAMSIIDTPVTVEHLSLIENVTHELARFVVLNANQQRSN